MARQLAGERAAPQKHRAGLSIRDPSCERPLISSTCNFVASSPRQQDPRQLTQDAASPKWAAFCQGLPRVVAISDCAGFG